MKKISFRHFSEKSIREQMQDIVIATILLFVLLCALVSISTRQVVYSNADEHTQITAIRLRDQIDLSYDKMKNYCVSIGEDAAVQELMRSDYSELSVNIKDATECLTKHKILEPAIEDISLVNDVIHHSTVYSYEELDEIRETVDGAPFRWIGVRKHRFASSGTKADMLVYAGEITTGQEKLGTIVISLDSSSLQIEDESEMNSSYFLIDADENIYPFNCSMQVAEDIWAVWTSEGKYESVYKGDYYIHSWYFEEMDCFLLATLNVGNGSVGLNRIELLIWCCVLLAVFFCAMFFFLISGSIVKPLYRFMEAIRDIRESRRRHLREELHLGGSEEITVIEKEFSGMLQDIESLNRQIFQSATDLYEMKVQKQEAELAWLRSQIDPHFLYNTLEVVRKQALQREAPEIAQIAVDMGHIFRYSTKGSYEVPLEEEISIIKSYIRIQQMRFQGKIEVYYFVSEEVLKLSAIKMLLQPIVENAIFHGLEPKSGKGSLYIGARKEEDQLILTVTDDGVGIPEEKLLEIQRELQEENVDTSKHVGILNTNARIRLQYGREYGLSVESCERDGTTVTMILPVREMEVV